MNSTANCRCPSLAILVLIGVSAFVAHGASATFTVSNLNDSGDGSLRQAITLSNANAASNKILFQEGLSGTITLSTELPPIVGSLVVTGPGATTLTVSGGNAVRVFNIPANSSLSVSGLTIANGSAPSGGGFLNAGSLSLDFCQVTQCASTTTDGGAILSTNFVIVTNSSFTRNVSARVAGVILQNGNELIVENCTFDGNSAVDIGGAMALLSGVTLFFSSTITHNTAAIGGGVFSNGPNPEMGNCILAGNSAPTAGPDFFGTVFLEGNSLVQSSSGVTLSPTGVGVLFIADPKLGDPGLNGGTTITLAPQSGLPSIDNGSNNSLVLATDQRGPGFPRISGAAIDMGAFEVQVAPRTFMVTNLNDSGPGSLRQAIFSANTIFNPDTIQFDPGLSGTLNLATELQITDSVTIIGPGAANVTIKSNGAGRVFNMLATAGFAQFTVKMSGVRITGGNAGTAAGGGIISNGTLTLSGCQITGNQGGSGGGIANGGTLILNDCSVTDNITGPNGNGGGIWMSGFQLKIQNSTLSGNTAAGSGGGVFIDMFTQSELTGVTIANNNAGRFGGGLFSSFFPVVSRNNIIAGNSAATSGPDAFARVDSRGHNLFQNTTGMTISGDQTGNLINVDPRLAPLANNGGASLTHALLPDSPAINAGDNADAPEFDQRGAPFRRIVGGTIDIGAFEFDHPPSIDSGPTATPSVVNVGQPVQFSAAASDADNDVLAFAWNFGDGSSGTGSAVSHAYNSAGNFTATLTVSDANAVSSSGSVSVQVLNLPLVGAGFDSDGDGFSDSFEVKAGTDPADINSNPLGAPLTALSKLDVSKLNIKLNFAKKGSDAISLSGDVPVPVGYSAAGKKLTVSIGDLVTVFTLDARGKATQTSDSAVISIKAKKGVAAAQTAKFAIKLNKGNFSDQLVAAGLVNTSVKNHQTIVPVDVILSNDGVFAKNQAVVYSAVSGKGGTAK